MKCEQAREFFADALYGELDDRRTAEFNAHLVSCASCAREYEGLKRTLAMMGERTRPEPTETQWREFSKKLDERLSAEPGFGVPASGAPGSLLHLRPTNGVAERPAARTKRPRLIRWTASFRPAWGYGIAALLLVAFGVYMGRTFFTGSPSPDSPATVEETITNQASTPEKTSAAPPSSAPGEGGRPAGRTGGSPRTGQAAGVTAEAASDKTTREALSYLERSRNLLIGLTNLDEKQSASLDLGRHQQVSRDLYDRGNTLAVALNQPSQQQLRQLVQHLQIILLQLSNMGVGDGTPAVELVRQSVDSKSILLKINLEAIRASLGEARSGGPREKSKHNL